MRAGACSAHASGGRCQRVLRFPPPAATPDLPCLPWQEYKTQWPFNPDSYLGYRGPDELETVTGEATVVIQPE